MATTIIPDINEPRDPNVDIDQFYETIKEWLISSQGDCDKAGNMDDEAFYAGQVTIAHGALRLLQGKDVNGNRT